MLNLKSNHRQLHLQVASWFEKSHETGFSEQAHSHYVERCDISQHARVEGRQHWLIEVPGHLKRANKSWTKLQTIAMVRRTRQVGEKTSEETHDYISSLP